jgi:hypothetical protein
MVPSSTIHAAMPLFHPSLQQSSISLLFNKEMIARSADCSNSVCFVCISFGSLLALLRNRPHVKFSVAYK